MASKANIQQASLGKKSYRPIRTLSLGLSVALSFSLAGCGSTDSAVETDVQDAPQTVDQPNIVMILLDDLGYTDLGSYGSEVKTPYIDSLAQQGTQFTNFHASPLCAPTRAELMTGQDRHRVGLGSMEGLKPPGVTEETPGYEGSLTGDFTGIAEVLGTTGYDTYQVGKWHLGNDEGQTPADLGFDQSFTLYEGGASYFADGLRLHAGQQDPVDTVVYERNGEPVDSLPEDFFATRTYTDEALRMVEQSADSDQPFFAYLAYTAPHDPLHVEDPSLIEKYSEIYTQDYNFETLRTQRIERLAEMGLLNEDVETRWPEQTPQWETLTAEQRDDLATRMAVYAAVIHETDQQIGRVVDYLKETGEYDNTLIVLASDNGASAANHTVYTLVSPEEGWHQENYPSLGDVELYGRQGSFTTLALPNAQVSSGPYFQAKNTLMEGGTRVPAIMKAPSGDGNYDHQITDAFAHMTDLYPTFVEYAGADLAASENLLGSSAKPLLEGNSDVIGDGEFGWEHLGQRAYRSGDWKLSFVPEPLGGTGSYALYNLAADPGETNDLKDEQPELFEELAEKWDKYAADNGVVAADFDQVNEVATRMAAVPYAIDWAAEVSPPSGAHNE